MGSFVENMLDRYNVEPPSIYIVKRDRHHFAPQHVSDAILAAARSSTGLTVENISSSCSRLYSCGGITINARAFHLNDETFGAVVYNETKELRRAIGERLEHLLTDMDLDDRKQLFLKRSSEYAAARSAQLRSRGDENWELWNWHKNCLEYWDIHLENLRNLVEKLKDEGKKKKAIALENTIDESTNLGFLFHLEKAGLDDWYEADANRQFREPQKVTGYGKWILHAVNEGKNDMRVVCQKMFDLSMAWYSRETAASCLNYLEKAASRIQSEVVDLTAVPVGKPVIFEIDDIKQLAEKSGDSIYEQASVIENPLEFKQTDYAQLMIELGLEED